MIKNGIIQDTEIYGVPFKAMILPKSRVYSTYATVQKDTVTIHETNNYTAGADAISHNNYLRNLSKIVNPQPADFKSWEFSVDDKIIVQNFPVNIPTYHTGNGNGNYKSIGVEICVNKDGDYEKAKVNAIKAITYLLFYAPGLIPEMKINDKKLIGNLKATIMPHSEWIKTDCPRKITAAPGGFAAYQQKIIDFVLSKLETPQGSDIDKLVAQLKIENDALKKINADNEIIIKKLREENKNKTEAFNDLLELKRLLAKKY